jgi:hypothetical protein
MTYSKFYDGVNGLFFIAFGIIFLITGELIMRRLFTYHLDFYVEYQRRIAVSTYGLSFPLIIRGIYEVVAFISTSVRGFAYDELCYYDIVMFFVGIILVIFF